MHHLYTRRLVILMVSIFFVAALVFGGAAAELRSLFAPSAAGSMDESGASVLPSGETIFANNCTSCHQTDEMAALLADSLDPDTTSAGQLEFLIGPPPHNGVTPAEALAVVIYFRTLAGLPSTYEPLPAVEATEAAEVVAAQPTNPPATVAQDQTAEAAAEASATEASATEAAAESATGDDLKAVFQENCQSCHRVGRMARGLGEVENPDLVSLQAIAFIATSRKHRDIDPAVIVSAFNYIRQEAGFAPLGPEALDEALAANAAEATPDS